MKTVALPASRVSIRYLTYVYGPGPIRPAASSSLAGLLSTGEGAQRRCHGAAASTLTHTLDVRVSNSLARALTRTAVGVGYSVHNYVLEVMCQWVRARVRMGDSVAAALRDFYAAHGIEEEDYMDDSSYKRVQRFVKKVRTYSPDVMTPAPLTRKPTAKVAMSLEECEGVAALLVDRCRELTYAPSERTLFCFIARSYAGIPNRLIGEHQGISPYTASGNWRRLAYRYVQEEAFADMVHQALEEVRAIRSQGVRRVAGVLPPHLPAGAISLRERRAA